MMLNLLGKRETFLNEVYFKYTMETTTIKLYPKTKHALDCLKQEQETYDQIISKMVAQVKKKNLVKELVEAYRSKAKEDQKIAEEWDAASEVE